MNIETDYDIGHILRTNVIPEAIFWFTGENGEEEDDEDYDGEDDDEDEDSDEEDDDEEDSDEDDEAEEGEEVFNPNSKGKGKGKGKGKKGPLQGSAAGGFSMPQAGAPNANGGENPECKQN